jgi:phosphatidylserine/phosphatidylglycerophosphate/cardiolipin synthase-like enzyme
MDNRLRSFFERAGLILVFCVISGFFFLASWKIREWNSPAYHAKKVLVSSSGALKGTIKKALFSPDDNIQQFLVTLIDQEKEHISAAVFSFTEGDIAQALINAAQRGVRVELIVDGESSASTYSKVTLIRQKGVPLWIYPSQAAFKDKSSKSGIMHDKFIIFGKTIAGQPVLWTGSFNFTRSANERNQENVLVLSDPELIAAYEHQFEILKKRSIPATIA